MSIANVDLTNTFTEWLTKSNQMIIEINRITEGVFLSTGNITITGATVTGDIIANVSGGALKATNIQLEDGSLTYPALTRYAGANVGLYFPSTNAMTFVTASNAVMYLSPSGNVAVGKTTANDTLDVSGTFAVSGRSVFSANVGIGKSAPAYELDVVGSIWATGNITMESDARVKEDIVVLNNPLEAVKSINGVSYTKKATRNREIGLIAQDVETVFPELISRNDGIAGVNYQGMVAVLIEAVKTLCERVEILEEEEEDKKGK